MAAAYRLETAQKKNKIWTNLKTLFWEKVRATEIKVVMHLQMIVPPQIVAVHNSLYAYFISSYVCTEWLSQRKEILKKSPQQHTKSFLIK